MFALYRKGHTHRVDGVECEIKRVTLEQLETYRSEGWVDNLEDLELVREKKTRAKKQSSVTDEQSIDENESADTD